MKAKIIELEEIDSTNLFCKRCIAEEFDGGLIVTAARQTHGAGTKGREFSSEEGGLYISIMRRLENFDFTNTFKIMINACVAVCKTLERAGLKAKIKWANDVLVDGKKICGTLIENRLSSGNICTSIVGIGINVNNVLPQELSNTATSVSEQKGKRYPLKKLRSRLIKNLQNEYSVDDYKSYIDWFGQEVDLTCGDSVIRATALDVDENGALVCEINGLKKKINSAEMSMRLKCSTI